MQARDARGFSVKPLLIGCGFASRGIAIFEWASDPRDRAVGSDIRD